jgi:hypothetical protein
MFMISWLMRAYLGIFPSVASRYAVACIPSADR